MLVKSLFFFVVLFLILLGISLSYPSGGGLNENTISASVFLILASFSLVISMILAVVLIIKSLLKK